MPESKQKLIEMIEAYGAARATGNSLLIQSAGATLVGYLEAVEIIEPEQPTTEPEQSDE
jgi:hypothetical protein